MDNPIRRIRKEHNLTQESAASLASVTTQVITRLEAGTFPEIPPDILKAFSYVSGEKPHLIEQQYFDWVMQELRKVQGISHNAEQRVRNSVDFGNWADTICELNDVPNTIHALAGLLKLHPYVLDKWSKGRMKEVPQQLIQRIDWIRKLQSNG